MRQYSVYILSSRSRTLYIGVTAHLALRLAQHRAGTHGFTAKYRIHRLVYVEQTEDVWAAIRREKQLKAFRRAKKIALITAANPAWNNLAEQFGLVTQATE